MITAPIIGLYVLAGAACAFGGWLFHHVVKVHAKQLHKLAEWQRAQEKGLHK